MAISHDAQGPRSERDFVHALRDHGLASTGLPRGERPLGQALAELEGQSGLSRPSVSGLIKRFAPVLVGQDVEGRDAPAGRARRWMIDPTAGIVIAVEIAQDHARVAVSDLYGRIERVRSFGSTLADETVEEAVQQIRELMNGRSAASVVGVGVSLATPVEREKGVIRPAVSAGTRADIWADWELMSVRENLRARLGWDHVAVLMDNDANVSALAESIWGAGRPSRLPDSPSYKNIIYVEWSKGIGAGLILDGQIHRGEGVAGEIGHTIIRDSKEAPICNGCGRRGCLDTVAGWDAILRALPEFTNQRSLSQDDLSKALVSATDLQSPAANAFAKAATDIGLVLGPAIHFLNPQLVIIGGDIGRHGYDIVRAPLLHSLKRYTMRPARADATVTQAKLGDHTALQGAVALVLRPSRGDPDHLLAFLQRKSGPRAID